MKDSCSVVPLDDDSVEATRVVDSDFMDSPEPSPEKSDSRVAKISSWVDVVNKSVSVLSVVGDDWVIKSPEPSPENIVSVVKISPLVDICGSELLVENAVVLVDFEKDVVNWSFVVDWSKVIVEGWDCVVVKVSAVLGIECVEKSIEPSPENSTSIVVKILSVVKAVVDETNADFSVVLRLAIVVWEIGIDVSDSDVGGTGGTVVSIGGGVEILEGVEVSGPVVGGIGGELVIMGGIVLINSETVGNGGGPVVIGGETEDWRVGTVVSDPTVGGWGGALVIIGGGLEVATVGSGGGIVVKGGGTLGPEVGIDSEGGTLGSEVGIVSDIGTLGSEVETDSDVETLCSEVGTDSDVRTIFDVVGTGEVVVPVRGAVVAEEIVDDTEIGAKVVNDWDE